MLSTLACGPIDGSMLVRDADQRQASHKARRRSCELSNAIGMTLLWLTGWELECRVLCEAAGTRWKLGTACGWRIGGEDIGHWQDSSEGFERKVLVENGRVGRGRPSSRRFQTIIADPVSEAGISKAARASSETERTLLRASQVVRLEERSEAQSLTATRGKCFAVCWE